MRASDNSQPRVLTIESLAKRFGATQALRGVSLEAHAGRVLALIGENGAGKSTLMKILAGDIHPDSGSMNLGGARYAPRSPLAARHAGVAMIYQELSLAPHLSIEDNVFLGREQGRFGFVQHSQQRRRLKKVLEELGHGQLSPKTLVSQLSPGLRQLVEIARAILFDSRVVIFDEPTSSLPQSDVEHLFKVIGDLKARGIAVIYISHFLEEIRRVADDVHVLRDGSDAGRFELAGVSDAELVRRMVGRQVDDLFPRSNRTFGELVLEAKNLSGRVSPRAASLQLRRGEIVGVAGLVGAGRTELLRCLMGLDPVTSGTVLRGARNLTGRSSRACIRQGLGYLSEDRKQEGLAQTLSIGDNLQLSYLRKSAIAGFVTPGMQRSASQELIKSLEIKCRGPQQEVRRLSGGNQQKVAIGRVLFQKAEILLLDEPTRGIDVGTKAEIYRLMDQLAQQGKAILFVSSYLPELMGVCDRIAVMNRGRLVALKNTVDWTEDAILAEAIA
jgi:ribose transport system ATP-binding protein